MRGLLQSKRCIPVSFKENAVGADFFSIICSVSNKNTNKYTPAQKVRGSPPPPPTWFSKILYLRYWRANEKVRQQAEFLKQPSLTF